MNENYFDPKYRESRRKVAEEIKELVQKELPQPQEGWETIWVLSGPEYNFEDKPGNWNVESSKEVNETKNRFLTGLGVARRVTAKRLKKKTEEVTIDDIRQSGPKVYFNGQKKHNDNLREMIFNGYFEKNYSFPSENIEITDNESIIHTGHQFEDFPERLVPKEGQQVVIVTDLYHFPRTGRYIGTKANKIPEDKIIFYPSQPEYLPPGAALREVKKIYPYVKKSILRE